MAVPGELVDPEEIASLETYLVIQLGPLACESRDVGGDARRHQPPVHVRNLLAILGRFLKQRGKVEPKGAVELDIDQPGGHDAPAQINGFIGHRELVKEGRLARDDLPGLGADPKVLPDKIVAPHKVAVGEPGDAILRPGGGECDGHG